MSEMHIDDVIKKLEERLENTSSHQGQMEIQSKLEELKEKRKSMEDWEWKQIESNNWL